MKVKKSIQLTTLPLDDLLKYKEAVDFRLDEESWKDLKVGDILEFWEDFSGWDKWPSERSRRVQVKLVEIFRASSFSDLIDGLPKSFSKWQKKEEIIEDLRKWWTPEREQQMGVLGFFVQVI